MTLETPTHNFSAPSDSSPHGGQEFTLRRACFVAVFLRVQIERRLNLVVTQDSLHVLRFDFRLVTSQLDSEWRRL